MKNVVEIKRLIDTLNQARDDYYNSGTPRLTDKQYDELYDKLSAIENESGILFSNSPTQSVGYIPKLDKFEKVEHKYHMLSAAKTKDPNEIVKFCNNKIVLCSWKLDGCSMQLEYENGELIKATTRGNGYIGCDVTSHAKVFKNVPLTIPFGDRLVLRGEAVMSYSTFEKVNSKGEFANPRNLVAGTLNQLDVNVCKERELEFICFEVLEGVGGDSLYMNLCSIRDLFGISIVDMVVCDESIDYIESIEFYENRKPKFDYPTDGLIFRFDSISYSNMLGGTSHHPNYMTAYKFTDEVQETTLRDIEWNTSRTGVVNPVAIFDSVELDGSNVTRASLHNIDIIKKLELGIGDAITVYKANQIIPQVEDNLTRSNSYTIPNTCPCCNGITQVGNFKGDATIRMCLNQNCSAQLVGKLTHFVSRDAMNIDGLSEETLRKLVDNGLVKSIFDLFKLSDHRKTIINMDGFGTTSYNKLIKSLEKAKNCKLENFLYGLGIPMVGKSTAKLLVKEFKTYDGIQEADRYDIKKIDGIGDIMADSIHNYFHSSDSDYADLLVDYVLTFEQDTAQQDNKLDGKVFVITGSVNHFVNRKELQAKIETLGGKVSGSVSAKTNYLINNDTTSTTGKNKKAIELGIEIISEEQFLSMINQ